MGYPAVVKSSARMLLIHYTVTWIEMNNRRKSFGTLEKNCLIVVAEAEDDQFLYEVDLGCFHTNLLIVVL